jgi:hypothetical protein
MTESEIEQEVMRRFPKCDEERRCRTTREFLNKAREAYRKKLNDKSGVQSEAHKENEQV